MEGTCNPQECVLFALLGGKPEQCPNFVESWWKPLEGEPKLVKDCAPKRTLLIYQELYSQQVRLQQASEEQRNEFGNLKDDLRRSNQELKRVGDGLQGIVAVLRRRLAIGEGEAEIGLLTPRQNDGDI